MPKRGIVKIFFGKFEMTLCFFWSAMASALELSHGCRFFPVSFLLLNHAQIDGLQRFVDVIDYFNYKNVD